jgi:hypothetical protein
MRPRRGGVDRAGDCDSHDPTACAESVGGARLTIRAVTVGGIATAEASTVPLRDPAGVFPDVTLRRLPASGIVIVASGVRVFFGTQEPSDRELARAQAELGTLSWR